MDINDIPKATAVLDWGSSTIWYRSRDDRAIAVEFEPRRQKATDLFRYCCVIAIAQDLETRRSNPSNWVGPNDTFLNEVAARNGWMFGPGTRRTYWPALALGMKGNSRVTTIRAFHEHGVVSKDTAHELFQTIPGYDRQVLGSPTPVGKSRFLFWDIEFRNCDPAFCKFKTDVLNTLRSTHPPAFQDVADGVRGHLADTTLPPKGFRRIDDVLGIRARRENSGSWFRESGPLAVDFDAGCIFLPSEPCEQLHLTVMKHQVSLLLGPRACGKTVLARHLAYMLYRDSYGSLYQFDCALNREYDPAALCRFIEYTGGFFLLEDMHLSPASLRVLCSVLKGIRFNGAVLLTLRTPARRDQQWDSLDDLPSVIVRPFEWARRIVDSFAKASARPEVFASPHVQEGVLCVSEGDYHLLGQALKGCESSGGKGDPLSWIRGAIQERLRRVEDAYADGPRALLGIAGLYQTEVMTAEGFLTEHVGVARNSLVGLWRLGEIIRVNRHDHFLYGLPHSSLARAYWAHGPAYWADRPKYENLLCDYAEEKTPNGLEAVVAAPTKTKAQVLDALRTNGTLASVIDRERSFDAITSWIKLNPPGYHYVPPLLGVLAKKISYATDLSGAGQMMFWFVVSATQDYTRALWPLVDTGQITQQVRTSLYANDGWWWFLSFLGAVNERLTRKVCESIPIADIHATLSGLDGVHQIGRLLYWSDKSSRIGHDLWATVDLDVLSVSLQNSDPHKVLECLGSIATDTNQANEGPIQQLMERINLGLVLENSLRDEESIRHSIDLVANLRGDHQKFLAAVCDAALARELVRQVQQRAAVSELGYLYGRMHNLRREPVRKLLSTVKLEHVVDRLNHASDVERKQFLAGTCFANTRLGSIVARSLNRRRDLHQKLEF